ncbi:MAG: hypothetical protein HY820_15865 [Acidobacteria bacterium]|nr:hypothetical protein [Acidobacteriota bacterium]
MLHATLGRCVLVIVCVALAGTLNAQTTKLPIADFLAVQGESSLFLYPVKDYLGWGQGLCPSGGLSCLKPPYTDYCVGYIAGVDYAGLAEKYIADSGGPSSGTVMEGSVLVQDIGNNRVEVTVSLHTRNALTFVMEPPQKQVIPGTSCTSPANVDFATWPLVLGARANTVPPPSLAQRALGESIFHIKYQAAKDKPLMDLMDLFFNHYTDIREYSFHAVADGPMPGGARGKVTVQQAGTGSRANLQPAIVNLRQTGK